jgi:hypothetical protein
MTLRRLASLAPILFVFACLVPAGVGCAGSSAVDPGEREAVGDDALTGDVAVARAEEWVAAQLHYCQSPNGARDYDAACSTYCSRTSNPAWDPYRSDCSGLVSWAWGLPPPGRVTGQFAPFENDITQAIDAHDLAPGDAVNNSEHVMLFKNWITPGASAVFIEEPGCSASQPYAREVTSNVSISGSSIYLSFNGMSFTAIHYSGVSGDEVGSSNCTSQETTNAGAFGCACADHHASGGYCDGTGCTAEETSNAGHYGCQCVDHQASGGFCDGSGCTARETIDASDFGCQCVDHQASGGFCDGSGCTAKETIDASKFGCQCVDHKGNGGYCPGSGCTAKETEDAAKFGCGCVDHKGAGGFCPGTGCTAKETIDCSNAGKSCSLHACVD